MAEKNKRKSWTKAETMLFLKCYDRRKNEFLHVRKKRFAYSKVLEDMKSRGFRDENATTYNLEGKMRTLMTTYKSARYTAKITGTGLTPGPYIKEMDAIFGDNPIISGEYSLNLGSDPIVPTAVSKNTFYSDDESLMSLPSASVISSVDQKPDPPTLVLLPSPLACSPALSLLSAPASPTPSLFSAPASPKSLLSAPSSPTASLSSAPTSPTPPAKSKLRKTAKEKYYEKKLALKKKQVKQNEKFYGDFKILMEAKWNKLLKIEAEKLKLFKEFLNRPSA